MKNVFKVSLLAACIALTVGCNDKEDAKVTTDKVASSKSAASFATEQDKVAYAIGASFSRYVESTLEKQAEFGMKLDKEIIIDGISDTLRGHSKLTDDEMMDTLKKYDETVKATVTKKMAEKKAKTLLEAKNFLAENAKVEGVTVTKSGLQYSIIKKADGPKPKVTDTVTVHYVGKLIDGTVFDSSIKRGQPAKFPLNRVIPGWTEGLQLMSVGEKMKFVIPADLAYGDQGAGTIPAGATLIFEVELLAINAPATTK
ncbi:peptidylprolyl isomerase [Psychromonas sp. PRT-SC03]|nr:peptidylprolyl isomerase [Psychromonas sp. PRT-SC03]